MTTPAHRLAELYLEMLNTHDPDLVADGMVAEHRDELNLMQLFQQIGVLPPLGGAPA